MKLTWSFGLLVLWPLCARSQDSGVPPSVLAPISAMNVGGSQFITLTKESERAAAQSVFRILCQRTQSSGTAFLVQGGTAVTAAHVVAGCTESDVVLVASSGKLVRIKALRRNDRFDVAYMKLAEKLEGGLALAVGPSLPTGSVVAAWGFPEGYFGLVPLLSAGYVAGFGLNPSPTGLNEAYFISAAFNRGNSGGPIVDLATGQVVGIVSAKVAPISADTQAALDFLATQRAGLNWTLQFPDGGSESISESQVVAKVLTHLRQQTQLMIGIGVPIATLRSLMAADGAK